MEREERLLYHLWFCQSCGHDPTTISGMLKRYQTPYAAFEHMQKKHANTTLDGAKRLLESCRKKDIRVLCIEDEAYPDLLREVYQPPLVLYVKGREIDFNQMLAIAVVGTRKCSEDGAAMSERLGYQLSKSGAVVISGMAEGIDGAAHFGAMKAGGATIAVLAGGVDLIYPKTHKKLYQHILDFGCIVSERPPGAVGKPYFYKERNRILVGMARGTVLVEGEKKSGSSLSARLTMENNRDVFAVPANPVNVVSELPNHLIRDGAKTVIHTLDVLEEYIELYPEKLAYGTSLTHPPLVGELKELKQKRKEKEEKYEPKEKKKETRVEQPKEKMDPVSWVEEVIQSGEFQSGETEILRFFASQEGMVSYDKLATGVNLPAGNISSTLIILQMKKLVVKCAGTNYMLNVPGTSSNK